MFRAKAVLGAVFQRLRFRVQGALAQRLPVQRRPAPRRFQAMDLRRLWMVRQMAQHLCLRPMQEARPIQVLLQRPQRRISLAHRRMPRRAPHKLQCPSGRGLPWVQRLRPPFHGQPLSRQSAAGKASCRKNLERRQHPPFSRQVRSRLQLSRLLLTRRERWRARKGLRLLVFRSRLRHPQELMRLPYRLLLRPQQLMRARRLPQCLPRP